MWTQPCSSDPIQGYTKRKIAALISTLPTYSTYLERDIRQIAHIGDLLIFQKLMRLCAARVGQQLNIAELATNLGVDQRKIKQWLSSPSIQLHHFFS